MASIEITNSQSGTISGNIASKYRDSDSADIVITDCLEVSVTDNLIEGLLSVANTPHVNVDGNKVADLSVTTSPNAVVANSTVIGGGIVLDTSSDAVVSGNVLSTEDDGTASSKVIHLTGVTTKPVVRDNTYQGTPNGSSEPVADFGLVIDGTVTGAKIGWNNFTEAGIPVNDLGVDTESLDAIQLSFGVDVAVLTSGTGLQPYPFDGFGDVVGARAVIGDAPTGSSVTVNVRVNGGSVFDAPGDVPEILAGANDSGFVKSGVSSALVDGDVLTVDIITVGSVFAGGYLTIIVYVRSDGR